MELKIYIRQTKIFNAQGQEIYLSGGNPQALQVNTGQLPAQRQWNKYNQYLNVTDSVSDLYKLKLTWTLERDDFGIIAPTAQTRKTSTGMLTFEGDAYQLIKKWLIDDISAPLNKIDVQIEHVGCGSYIDWTIKATDITWCEDTTCVFDIVFKQKEEPLTCIKNTLIADNWQGWFPDDGRPAGGKRHPRFSYCNETRPNAILVALWFIIVQMMGFLLIFVLTVAPIYNTIVFIVVNVINPIIRFLQNIGFNLNELKNPTQYITWSNFQDIFVNFFIESAGCGREHPAPLIRDYISNVCNKCGVKVDANTAPIFFASQINIETSVDRVNKEGAQLRENPHYNACYLGAIAQKGIRRFDALQATRVNPNTTDFWLPENTPIKTLEQFLNDLKGVYNAEWRVTNNTLYFQRKDFWLDDSYAFDFSATGADRTLLLEGLCFEWNEISDPAIITGLYSLDAADTPGNAGTSAMNGTVDLGVTALNPNMEGVYDKTVQFAATKFRLDGSLTDYILDAYQQVLNTTFITGSVWTPGVIGTIDNDMADYADYALLVKQETTTLPKIMIWDGRGDYTNAKAVKRLASVGGFGHGVPSPNIRYNNYPYTKNWDTLHPPRTKVLGNPNLSTGEYVVTRTFLAAPLRKTALLVNYPMYFNPQFEGTLWDWFHWIDDPLLNPSLHQTFTAKLENCCETLKDRVKPFNDSKDIILGQKVKLPTGFFTEGRVTELTISYDTSDRLGQYIEIKGKT